MSKDAIFNGLAAFAGLVGAGAITWLFSMSGELGGVTKQYDALKDRIEKLEGRAEKIENNVDKIKEAQAKELGDMNVGLARAQTKLECVACAPAPMFRIGERR